MTTTNTTCMFCSTAKALQHQPKGQQIMNPNTSNELRELNRRITALSDSTNKALLILNDRIDDAMGVNAKANSPVLINPGETRKEELEREVNFLREQNEGLQNNLGRAYEGRNKLRCDIDQLRIANTQQIDHCSEFAARIRVLCNWPNARTWEITHEYIGESMRKRLLTIADELVNKTDHTSPLVPPPGR